MRDIHEVCLFEFYGQILPTATMPGGQPVVLAKELVDNLGLSWKDQTKRITSNPIFNSSLISTKLPGDDRIRQVIALPINRVSTYLASINVKKIPPAKHIMIDGVEVSVREHVTRYQLQCADVLYDFWHKTPRIPDIQVTGAHLQRTLPKFGKYLHKIATKDQIAELEDFIKSFVPAVLGVHYCDYDGRMIQATEGSHMVRMNHVEVAVLAIVESFLVDCMHIAIEEEYAIDDIFHMMETSMDQRLTQVRDLLSTYLSQQKRI